MATLHITPQPLAHGPGPFWDVRLDDGTHWPDAHPFAADADRIVLSECLECYHCGSPNTLVRQAGDAIVWLRSQDDFWPEFEFGEAKVFARKHYESVLGGSAANLPQLSGREIRTEIQSQRLPQPRDGLYRIPEVADDSQGRTWLDRLIAAILVLDDSVRIIEAPEEILEIRVGLEIPGVPEVVTQLGMVDNDVAVLLAALPRFPLWIADPVLTSQIRPLLNF